MVIQPQVICMWVCVCVLYVHMFMSVNVATYLPQWVHDAQETTVGTFLQFAPSSRQGLFLVVSGYQIAGPWPSMDSPSSTTPSCHTSTGLTILSSPSFRFWGFKLRSSYLQNNCFTHRPISPDDIYLLYVLISERCHECCENCEPDFFTLCDSQLTLQSNRVQWPFQDSHSCSVHILPPAS